jgi:branched-chain amino acid aminotransferase
LVEVDKRWIPKRRSYSLYIRPTIIGTRSALGVAASTNAMLYVILTPSGPYFPSGIRPVSILASVDCQTPSTSLNPDGEPPARSWPGGTGEFNLGINYAPAFDPQRTAAKKGYDQVLWVLDDKNKDGTIQRRITECGQMNLFFIVSREDGGQYLAESMIYYKFTYTIQMLTLSLLVWMARFYLV